MVRRDGPDADGGAGGRYGFHDLLRDYARELTGREDAAEVREAALARLYRCYLHNGQDAHAEVFPQRLTFPRRPADPAVPLVPITGRDAGIAWYAAERESLIAAVRQAAGAGRDGDAWHLADIVAPIVINAGDRERYAAVVAEGLAAAERAGDPTGVALMAGNHAISRVLLGDLDAGVAGMRRVAELFEAANDQRGIGFAELELGTFASRAGDPGAASVHAERALNAFVACGDRPGQGKALNNLGWYRYRIGDLAGAVTYGERSLAIQRAEGYRWGQADVLDTLGVVYHELGDFPAATAHLTEAVAVSMEVDDQLGGAECLVHLAEVQTSAGDVAAARSSYTRALAIYEQADHPDAAEVRQKLDQLGPGPPLSPPV
jgi:tetratricopeptide (TPR) repeat protein